MGVSTDAMLVYGYDLGSDEGWLLENAGEYGELPELDWYDPEDEESDGFADAVEEQLLTQVAGFTEEWKPGIGDDYWKRKREAEARVGVEIETHCSGDYPMYLLVAKGGVTAYRGTPREIDFAKLEGEVLAVDADAKLCAALDALGLKPKQKQAQWLLCSYWG